MIVQSLASCSLKTGSPCKHTGQVQSDDQRTRVRLSLTCLERKKKKPRARACSPARLLGWPSRRFIRSNSSNCGTCRPSIMRLQLTGLLITAAILSIIVLAQHRSSNQASTIDELNGKSDTIQLSAPLTYAKRQQQQQQQQTSTITTTTTAATNGDSSSCTLEDPTESYQKVEQGYLNLHNHFVAYNNPTVNRVLASMGPIELHGSVRKKPVVAQVEREPPLSAPPLTNYPQNDDQLIEVSESESHNDAITIDKIKGLDLPSIKSMNYNEAAQIDKASAGIYSPNVKCNKNKFDRKIARRLNKNDLSRPIVKSNGRFDNPFPTWNAPSIFDAIKFIAFETDESNVPRDPEELDRVLPILEPKFSNPNGQSNGSDFRVTWIGHSTLLIQVDGLNILTDPVFSDRASPSQYVGPKRIRRPACDIKSLPPIDVVLISHNHFDHLDADSVAELDNRFGENCRWIVPLGLGEFFSSMDVKNYVELDWWQKDCYNVGDSSRDNANSNPNNRPKLATGGSGGPTRTTVEEGKAELNIYLTPAQHWSRRGVNDVNKSLWGSFVIVNGKGSTFFFGGDTAYCSAFKEIGEIFGPFAGAAIPIGAYKPRWFMRVSHVDPHEAVQIHRDIKSMKSIAIHHSTFMLSNEYYREPVTMLNEIMHEMKTKLSVEEPFVALKHGESMNFCKSC